MQNKYKIVDSETGNINLGEFTTKEEAEKMLDYEYTQGVCTDCAEGEFEVVEI